MDCPNCQHKNPPDATNCALCLRPLDDSAGRTGGGASGGLRKAGECQQCGRTNPPQAERCKGCGAGLARPRLKLKPKVGSRGFAVRSRLAKTYLICPPLPPLQLEEGVTYTLGRGERADILLPGELVSRQHARLVSSDASWFLEDLGSANGTFLNGKRVQDRHEIDDGDDIVVGGFHMEIHVQKGRLAENQAFRPQISGASTVYVDVREDLLGDGEGGQAVLEGKLEDVSLVGVLQLLNLSKRSGEILVTVPDDGTGMIVIVEGEIFDAALEAGQSLSGKAAVLELGVLQEGHFQFRKTKWNSDRVVTETTKQLLTEIAKLRKERRIT